MVDIEADRISGLPCADGLAYMGNRQRSVERKSTRRHQRYNRNLDSALRDLHVKHHAASADHRMVPPHTFPQNARRVYVRSRRLALRYRYLVGPISRLLAGG